MVETPIKVSVALNLLYDVEVTRGWDGNSGRECNVSRGHTFTTHHAL